MVKSFSLSDEEYEMLLRKDLEKLIYFKIRHENKS